MRVSFEQQRQAYEKDMKDLNDFFEQAHRYAQAKAPVRLASAPTSSSKL